MFLSLHELELRTVRFDVDIPAGEIEYGNEIHQSSNLHAEGSARLLSRSLGEIRIEGRVQVTVQGACDRCLEPAAIPVDKTFDLVYLPAPSGHPGAEEIESSATEVGFYEGNGLALNEILREIVLLALPMQVVCSETCKGICPECGRNRNQADCGCHTQAADDRWSKLRSFRAEIAPRN